MNQAEVVAQAINDIIVTHPMWIDDNGKDLDYTAERESRISDFIDEASKAVVLALAAPETWQGSSVERGKTVA